MRTFILLIILLLVTGCSTNTNLVNESKEPSPPPVRLEQADEGFVVTGQLNGASLVDFAALTEDEKKFIATGNANILSNLLSINYNFYRTKPVDWNEFRATPLMRNIVLYNPYSGKPIELSPTFSPGDLKIFGYDKNGRYGVAFYDSEDTGLPGAAAGLEFTPGEKTLFDVYFKEGGPNRMPTSDIEWDWFFVGIFVKQMIATYGDVPGNLTSNATQLCHWVHPNNIFIYSILEPGGNGKILNLDGIARALSLTIKVYPEYESVVFNVRGSDETPLLRSGCGTNDPYTSVPPPMD